VWYPADMPLSRRREITSARVDPGEPAAIFRRLRDPSPRPVSEGPCGGTGRRARLKIEFRKECWFDSGQGHQNENANDNNNLDYWFDSIFSGKFSWRVENTRKSSRQPSGLLAFLLVSGRTNVHGEFRYSERGN
jgi:hypothetical protein